MLEKWINRTMHDKESAIEVLLKALKEGKPEYVACQAAGIAHSTWWEWKQDDPGLNARVDSARRSRVILLEDALYKTALKGSVTACLVLLRKESKQWRELLDGQIVPGGEMAALGHAAAAGAAAVIAMLTPEKRLKIKQAMYREGLLELPPPSINGNGNGSGPGH